MTSTMHRPRSGDSVWTADGEQFAYVKETQGDYFKLDVPMAQDFWLSCTHISGISDGKVRLKFAKDEIDDHRLDEPGVDSPATGDAVISADQMVEQRERMERDLEVQREKLRSGL